MLQLLTGKNISRVCTVDVSRGQFVSILLAMLLLFLTYTEENLLFKTEQSGPAFFF